jgi:hypothetical protein
MAVFVFIEESPVTSSNCNKTINYASIVIKLDTNVDWTIDFVTTWSFLISCYHGNEGISQNCRKSLFCIVFFSIKIDFKVLQLLNGLRKSQRLFSVGYTLLCNRSGVICSFSQVQNFLSDEGDCRSPSKPQTEGAHTPYGNLPMYLLDREPSRKSSHFFKT